MAREHKRSRSGNKKPVTISQLIRKLQTAYKQHGDIFVGVLVPDITGMVMPIQDIVVSPGTARVTLITSLSKAEKYQDELG